MKIIESYSADDTFLIGKEIGDSLGGSFGKKIGGNVGASLGRGILSTLFKM